MRFLNIKILHALALAVGAMGMTSCESLDFTPADQMSGGTFWQTEEHARQAAVGMYSAMRAPWCFGMEFTFDMCSDLADGVSPWADITGKISMNLSTGAIRSSAT